MVLKEIIKFFLMYLYIIYYKFVLFYWEFIILFFVKIKYYGLFLECIFIDYIVKFL